MIAWLGWASLERVLGVEWKECVAYSGWQSGEYEVNESHKRREEQPKERNELESEASQTSAAQVSWNGGLWFLFYHELLLLFQRAEYCQKGYGTELATPSSPHPIWVCRMNVR